MEFGEIIILVVVFMSPHSRSSYYCHFNMAIYFEQYNDHLRRKYHHHSTPFYSRIQAPFQHRTRSLGTERGGDTRGYFIVLAFIRQSPNNTES